MIEKLGKSDTLADYPASLRFAAGAGFGVVYEAVNLTLLRAWSFPNQQLLFLRGPVALAVGAGIPCGLLPLVAHFSGPPLEHWLEADTSMRLGRTADRVSAT